MAEATLRLCRLWSGLLIGGQGEAWDITLDGRVVGTLADGETVRVTVAPGRHTLRLGQGRHLSPQRAFEVSGDSLVSYACHGPRIWPKYVAALLRSDLWITLLRD